MRAISILTGVLAIYLTVTSHSFAQSDSLECNFTLFALALENFYPKISQEMTLTNYVFSEDGSKKKQLSRRLTVEHAVNSGRHLLRATFTYPQEVDKTSILVVERDDGTEGAVAPTDYFIYLPAFRIVRRVTGAQRKDPFFGTLLSQGDMEVRTQKHFRIIDASLNENEKNCLFVARPLFEEGYDEIHFFVRTREAAIVRILQFSRGNLLKRITAMDFEDFAGYRLPRRLIVENLRRGDMLTEVEFTKRDDTPASLQKFTVADLTRGR